MAIKLRQSTASQEIPLGYFVDSTDGDTEETGLTIANTDIKLWKMGATTLANKNSGGATHISNGIYYCVLDATDTNTLGGLIVFVHVSGALSVRVECEVLPANIYDSWIAGSDVLDVSVTQWTGTAVATPDTAGYPKVTIKSGSGTGEISLSSGGVSLSTSGLNATADAVWDEALSGHVTAGSAGARLYTIRSNTAQAGSGTTITLDASASAVDDFYNNQSLFIVSGTGAGQGRIIEDYVGSTKVATVASWATNPSSDSVFVIVPFGSIPGATAPSAATVADAVWDEARSGHTSAGTYGEAFTRIFRSNTAQGGTTSSITLDASASATNNIYNYNAISIVSGTGAGQSRQITAYNGSSKVATVGVDWTTAPSSDSVFLIEPLGVDAATVAAIADAVWDEARSGHATAGTFGEYTFADTVRLSGDSTAADNAEAAFDGTGFAFTNCAMPSTGSVTGNVGGNVAGSVGSVTGNVGGNIAGSVASVSGNVDGNVTGSVGSVAGNVDGDVSGNVDGSIGSLATQAKADVNAEVVDALATDTYAEPGQGAPGATVSLSAKISYIYKGFRNKHTQTTTEYSLYADDASTVDQKATVSDDGTTFTRGELITGA